MTKKPLAGDRLRPVAHGAGRGGGPEMKIDGPVRVAAHRPAQLEMLVRCWSLPIMVRVRLS
jgi:hypothetical protein